MLADLKGWARALKRDVLALHIAARDPRTPWLARGVALAVAAYALSPIDLIPDFIPVFGLLDDLILLPVGIWTVLRLIPPDLMAEYRDKAAQVSDKPRSTAGLVIVIVVWGGALLAAGWWFFALPAV